MLQCEERRRVIRRHINEFTVVGSILTAFSCSSIKDGGRLRSQNRIQLRRIIAVSRSFSECRLNTDEVVIVDEFTNFLSCVLRSFIRSFIIIGGIGRLYTPI